MRDIFTILVVGCIGANAAVNHYDLLGRRGSEMNSPMVYKDIDYTKLKKNEPQKESTPPGVRALQKMGLSSNVNAIEGAFRSDQGNFYFRQFKTGETPCSGDGCLHNLNDYLTKSNDAFIEVREYKQNVSYNNNERADWSNIPSYVQKYNANTNNSGQPSPYNSGSTISYVDYSSVKTLSYYDRVSSWFDGNNRASKVGVYMAVEGLPAMLSPNDQNKIVFKRNKNTDSFKDGPGYENRESKAYKLIKDASTHNNQNHTVVYVGRGQPTTPASKNPQIYMGVRNDKVGSNSAYNSLAQNLDNFIYQYRTLEFVPAGNYGDGSNYLNSQAHAANAVTVGAANTYWQQRIVSTYSSTGYPSGGSKKPEIYNFSDFVERNRGEVAKYYHYGSRDYTYQPYYDGTEMSTAYTAGMVANLLAVNPFYRWHPEVVKAFLITADGGQTISNAYSAATDMTLSYQYLVFDYANSGNNLYKYDSRYWNGNIYKLKTRAVQDGDKVRYDIFFVTRNLGSSTRTAKAAISWLSSGDDIANNNGKVPQDFDLHVFGSDKSYYECLLNPGVDLNNPSGCNRPGYFDIDNPGTKIAQSMSSTNSYEVVSFKSGYPYLVFMIRLWEDNSSSANKGQIALGFNLSAPKY